MRSAVAFVVLWLAVCPGAARAQETTGDVVGTIRSQDGAVLPGVTVTIENFDRGFERSTISGARGSFFLPALRPARYELTFSLSGFQTVKRPVPVELGGTATMDIQMQVGEFTDTIEVTGVTPLVDVKSTVSGLTVSTDELNARLPVARDVTRVAMLAPGTIDADPRFDGVSDMWNPEDPGRGVLTPGQNVPAIGGASAGENGYLVNGLNITNFRQMVGSNFVPMDFVDEVQVKTGGFEAEFGRSTGGVINLVTKSGTNTLRGGISLYWNPEGLQELEPDTYARDTDGALHLYRANSNETRRSLEANASLGGPLIKDRLFFFAFVRFSDWDRLDMLTSNLARESAAGDPYWGGKLDWAITPAHRLEGTFISDEVAVDEVFYAVDPATGAVGAQETTGYSDRGGQSWIVKYSGLLRDNLLLSAQAGVNPFARTTRSDADDLCPVALDYRDGSQERIGCWVNFYSGMNSDEREAYRADLDWFLGRHNLRAGVDAETNTSFSDTRFSGDEFFSYFLNGMSPVSFPEFPVDQELVVVVQQTVGGSFDVLSNAAYLQDGWAVTTGLTINLGVRWERFEVKNPLGETFMEVNDQYAPRIGAVWDVGSNGRSKLYGSFGVYHLPMSTYPAADLARGDYLDQTWYTLLGGIDPVNGSPEELGEMLETEVRSDGSIPDPRESVDSDFDPMSQSELILGYERLIGDSWSLGVRGIGRRFNEIIEDFYLAPALYEVYGLEECSTLWRGCAQQALTNPGSDFSGWYDLDGDGELDPIYLTAEQIGLPDADRTYLAVELTAQRRFSGRWMLVGSYTWSHLYGNYDGIVLSDRGQAAPYLTQTFDLPALMEHGDGDLPNDRRHNLKLYGMYAFDFGLQLSGNAWFRSGRPVNSFGWHPTDPWAQNYSNPYAFYTDGVPCPRGCAGRTESVWALDLGVKYDWRWLGADWNLRVDAFNVTDNSSVEVVEENAEDMNHQPNPSYLLPRYYQTPRQVRFGFGVSF